MPKPAPKYLTAGLILTVFIGLFDSFYLSVERYIGGTPLCFITTGCDEVTRSAYSVLFGVPLAYLGALYYLLLVILSIIFITSENPKLFIKLIFLVSGLGILFSAYFVYLQIFVIEAICIYCMISALTTTTAFILSGIIKAKLKNF